MGYDKKPEKKLIAIDQRSFNSIDNIKRHISVLESKLNTNPNLSESIAIWKIRLAKRENSYVKPTHKYLSNE